MFEYNYKKLKANIVKKSQWTNDIFHLIKWQYIDQAMHHSTTCQGKGFMKITHQKWATKYLLGKHINRHDNHCNRCGRIHETWNHIFQCPSSEAQEVAKQKLKTLQTFLSTSKTIIALTNCMITGIQQWITNFLPPSCIKKTNF